MEREGMDKPADYIIRVQGRISPRWQAWFDGLEITTAEGAPARPGSEGIAITTLAGAVPDQAALSGLLQKLYTLGLPLVEVQRHG
jgi:hypothetical protein